MERMSAPQGATPIPHLRAETSFDAATREALLDRVMGPERVLRTSERLRQGQTPAVALVAQAEAQMVGTVRLWPIKTCGTSGALLLGPSGMCWGVCAPLR